MPKNSLRQIKPDQTETTNKPNQPRPTLFRTLVNLHRHQLDLRELRQLMTLDASVLADIGLDRSAVLAEYRRLHSMSWTTRRGYSRKQPASEWLETLLLSAGSHDTSPEPNSFVEAQVTALKRRR